MFVSSQFLEKDFTGRRQDADSPKDVDVVPLGVHFGEVHRQDKRLIGNWLLFNLKERSSRIGSQESVLSSKFQ